MNKENEIRLIEFQIAVWETERNNALLLSTHPECSAEEHVYFAKYAKELEDRIFELVVLTKDYET